MLSFNRRNTIWLAILAALIAIVLISGTVAVEVQFLLLAIFAAAVMASFFNPAMTTNFVQSLQQRSPLNRARLSPQAKEAIERAQSRGGYYASSRIDMIDLGMIASQSGKDGMVMRRTRSISKDDDGVRPFITLQVSPEEADRNAMIRFEIFDQNGREQYIHEMKTYLRDGEMNILADHHLPLMTNGMVEGMGDWDLRIFIDNSLVGIHAFTLAPSYDERRSRMNRGQSGGRYYVTDSDGERATSRLRDDAEDSPPVRNAPMSLEDLLRDDSNNQQSQQH
ncbi:MAG: hypothetical protein RLP44_04340 [Aggregatilineales bacterium]